MLRKPPGSKKLRKATLTQSRRRCWNRAAQPLLSSLAHVFFSPGRRLTKSSTLCHYAALTRKRPFSRRSAVELQSFSPASAAVLSEALGSAKHLCLAPMTLRSVMANASCARVSKHAIYRCAGFCSAGQRARGHGPRLCSTALRTMCSALRKRLSLSQK